MPAEQPQELVLDLIHGQERERAMQAIGDVVDAADKLFPDGSEDDENTGDNYRSKTDLEIMSNLGPDQIAAVGKTVFKLAAAGVDKEVLVAFAGSFGDNKLQVTAR